MLAYRCREDHPFDVSNEGVNQLFSDFFGGGISSPKETKTPAMNIYESDDSIVVEAQVPGFSLKEINIRFEKNTLTIIANKKKSEVKSTFYHWKEIESSGFERSVKLAIEINASKATAELALGILKIILPKHKATFPQTIEIKSME